MINPPQDRHAIGQARLLRRQGQTYDEIRTVIGEVSDDKLRAWLKGIPRPPGTYRGNAHTEVRRHCRRLRAEGMTYEEIAAVTGASKSSLSLWLGDMPIDKRLAEAHRLEAVRVAAARTRERRAAVRADVMACAAEMVGTVTGRELLFTGLALYWAEGAKSKPWALREHIGFINSDPDVIQIFMRWLDLLGVDRARCRFHLSIHENADIASAEAFWANLVGVDGQTFNRTSIKRHNPKSRRYNTGVEYRGCLIVDVLQSADLYRQVAGWWHGLVLGACSRGDQRLRLSTDLSRIV